MQQPTAIDDQPISATFFGEGRWLSSFVTPDALEVQELHEEVIKTAENPDSLEDRITVLWCWVADKVKYSRFIKGKIWVNGHTSVQDDLWLNPSMAIRTQVGNCANKAFLLASLIRNELPADKVYAVLGNLYNGKPGGHAWVQVRLNSNDYIMETTRPDIAPFVLAFVADRYEPVHLFNDQEVKTVEGKTVMVPFTACYSTWLKDYLDWTYIEGTK